MDYLPCHRCRQGKVMLLGLMKNVDVTLGIRDGMETGHPSEVLPTHRRGSRRDS